MTAFGKLHSLHERYDELLRARGAWSTAHRTLANITNN